MYKDFVRDVVGNPYRGERVIVSTSNYYAYAEIVEANLDVVEVRIHSNEHTVDVDLTVEGAKQLAQHLLDAVEFLENS